MTPQEIADRILGEPGDAETLRRRIAKALEEERRRACQCVIDETWAEKDTLSIVAACDVLHRHDIAHIRTFGRPGTVLLSAVALAGKLLELET